MLPAFIVDNQAALLFYAVLIFVIFLFRKKLEWQGIIGMYRTKIGLKLMESWGKKYRGLVILLGYIGVGVGFIIMVAIVVMFIKSGINMFLDPSAPPPVSPVIPGFKVLGFDFKVPLIAGWLALFVVILIHEFSHGVAARAHKLKVKSSGLFFLGPLAGAFVEPDEKKLPKAEPIVQYSIFAAGPWSNILSGFLFLLINMGVLLLISSMMMPAGVEVTSVMEGYPAEEALIQEGMIITSINGEAIRTGKDLLTVLDPIGPGEVMQIGTDQGSFQLITLENPDAPGEGYMGIIPSSHNEPKNPAKWFGWIVVALEKLYEFFYWVVLLSFGIGSANLLPIGPIDGGRMLQTAARQITGSKKRGDWWWKKISVVTLGLLLVLLAYPILRSILT